MITLNLFPHRLSDRSVELLETRLQLQLVTKLWSPESTPVSAGQMALYVQALKASCIDPFNFYGFDLVKNLSAGRSGNKFDEWLIQFTLCLIAKDRDQFETLMGQKRLESLLEVDHEDSAKKNQPGAKSLDGKSGLSRNDTDTMAMKALALSCYSKFAPENKTIRHDLNDQLAKILWTQEQDGSFNGNLITTALSLQAFIESGLEKLSFLWDRKKAVQYINNHLDKIRPIDAYHVVPAFHETWSQIDCKKQTVKSLRREKETEERSLFTNVHRWFSQEPRLANLTLSRWVNIQGNGTKISLSVPGGSDLLKALKNAAKKQTSFSYNGSQTDLGFYIRSVGDVAEDGASSWTIHHIRDGSPTLTGQSKFCLPFELFITSN